MEPGYVIERPNRQKASSKTTKAVIVLLLIATAALIAIVTVFGWSTLQGAQGVQIGYIAIYLVMAFYVARWNRGMLPLAAALSMLLIIFSAVAGPSWFDRDKPGFAAPHMLGGGGGLGADALGLITLLIIPVQVLLIAFAMQGFRQEWHVELEVPADEARRRSGGGTRPATV
jgi:hypothetical protein